MTRWAPRPLLYQPSAPSISKVLTQKLLDDGGDQQQGEDNQGGQQSGGDNNNEDNDNGATSLSSFNYYGIAAMVVGWTFAMC